MDKEPVILINERDLRTWEWLKNTIDPIKLDHVIDAMKGKRKPYVSYICKALNVQPPRAVKSGVSNKEFAMMQIERAKAILRGEVKVR